MTDRNKLFYATPEEMAFDDQSENGGSKFLNRLFGMGGEGRYQLWPEKMIRSALTLPGDVAAGRVYSMPGLRREDVTDIPAPNVPTADSTRLGQFLGISPVRAEPPTDPVIERAQDLANLAIGGTLPAVAARGVAKNTLGSGPVPKKPELKAIEGGGEGKRFNTGLGDEGELPATAPTGQLGQQNKITVAQSRAPTFYSGVENALESVNMGVATPDQWLGTLKNAKGVKQEELDWLGVPEFLAEKKAAGQKVSRAELQDYVDQNKVEIQEVKKSGAHIDDDVVMERADKLANDYWESPKAWQDAQVQHIPGRPGGDYTILDGFGNVVDRFETQAQASRGMREWAKAVRDQDFEALYEWSEVAARRGMGDTPATKYSEYQLPGGEDYTELLLTLPEAKKTSGADSVQHLQIRENPASLGGKFDVIDTQQNAIVDSFNTRAEAQREINKIAGDVNDRYNRTNYQSGHWDEPNVLAHVRFNTRNIDGKKTLFIEEVQSDWHQAGKKKGYKTKEPTEEEVLKYTREWINSFPSGKKWEEYSPSEQKDYLSKGRDQLTLYGSNSVPDAPFKKSWPELAMKRMMRYASENGYDAIAWTPGDVQAARYDLSKQVDKIDVARTKNGGFLVTATKDGREVIEQTAKDAAQLEGLIGKDLAKKAEAQEPGTSETYKGLDLKVGGEGMKRFYDDQLPLVAQKFAKAHGGKVETKRINSYLKIENEGAKNPRLGAPQLAPGANVDPSNLVGLYDGDTFINNYQKRYAESILKEKYRVNDMLFSDMASAQKYLDQQSPKVHYMELPSGLRDTALQKGFPLFSSGLMLVPVEGNPFEDER